MGYTCLIYLRWWGPQTCGEVEGCGASSGPVVTSLVIRSDVRNLALGRASDPELFGSSCEMSRPVCHTKRRILKPEINCMCTLITNGGSPWFQHALNVVGTRANNRLECTHRSTPALDQSLGVNVQRIKISHCRCIFDYLCDLQACADHLKDISVVFQGPRLVRVGMSQF